MRAVVFEEFGVMPQVRQVGDPRPGPGGVVIEVAATGLCRSDWHGWRGHDPDITVPHIPGHELSGVIAEVGADVINHRPGQRVTVPFVCGCGSCASCRAGASQVCERQTQPGFTGPGSFAEYVAIAHADHNLVRLPSELSFATAASLGCRFATAFRAVVAQGRVRPGEWVAVHGCGGVGLSAIMIAAAAGARVVAVDVSASALELAAAVGAAHCIDVTSRPDDVAELVSDLTSGGAHLSVDALGSPHTCARSINGLRRHGRHVQVGLLPAAAGDPALPMERVIGWELEVLGSHGMAAHHYPAMMEMIVAGTLRPDLLVKRTIELSRAPAALAAMADAPNAGITVIDPRLP